MKFVREVRPEEALPRGYGVAYRDYCRNVTVCTPVPFNWLVRWARDAWGFVARPGLGWSDKRQYEMYTERYNAVRKEVDVRVARELWSNRAEPGSDPVVNALIWFVMRCEDAPDVCVRAGLITAGDVRALERTPASERDAALIDMVRSRASSATEFSRSARRLLSASLSEASPEPSEPSGRQ